MKVVELINRAYYYSNKKSRDLDSVSSDELENGLRLLNDLISLKNSDTDELPYYQTIEMPAVVGQSDYFIPNMYSLDCMTFNIGQTRYSMKAAHRKYFKGSSRQENIRSLPAEFYYERVNGGCNVSLYFLPNDTYPLKFTGLQGFVEITDVDQELNENLDRFYQTYLIYDLAKQICFDSGLSPPPLLNECLKKAQASIRNNNYRDTSFNYLSPFKRGFVSSGDPLNAFSGNASPISW